MQTENNTNKLVVILEVHCGYTGLLWALGCQKRVDQDWLPNKAIIIKLLNKSEEQANQLDMLQSNTNGWSILLSVHHSLASKPRGSDDRLGRDDSLSQ